MDPKPVTVIFPNGMEEMGIAISEDVLEVGATGTVLEASDEIVVDGARRQVVEAQSQPTSREAMGMLEAKSWVASTRVKHRPASGG